MRANEDLEVKTVGLQLHEKAEEKKACCGRWMLTIIFKNFQRKSIDIIIVKLTTIFIWRVLDVVVIAGQLQPFIVIGLSSTWLLLRLLQCVQQLIAWCTLTYCKVYIKYCIICTNLLQYVHQIFAWCRLTCCNVYIKLLHYVHKLIPRCTTTYCMMYTIFNCPPQVIAWLCIFKIKRKENFQ
jgi:hypothetical protein